MVLLWFSGGDEFTEYKFAPSGLFPIPLGRHTKAATVNKVKAKFKFPRQVHGQGTHGFQNGQWYNLDSSFKMNCCLFLVFLFFVILGYFLDISWCTYIDIFRLKHGVGIDWLPTCCRIVVLVIFIVWFCILAWYTTESCVLQVVAGSGALADLGRPALHRYHARTVFQPARGIVASEKANRSW